MIRTLLLFFFTILLVSCEDADTHSGTETWIGGEIVNPKSDYVLILRDDQILDTAKLDHKNFFLFNSECMKAGLYSFQHYEYQIFFAEPGDSLMLRVNTVDFDESLTYSGRGAEKNNFLMELFLLNESENLEMSQYYGLSAMEFDQKVDSMKMIKNRLFSEFELKNAPCDKFKAIARANIDYDCYSKKELYTSAKLASNFDKVAEFPEEFFEYRNDIDLGNESLRYYYPYYRLLNRYFDNLSFEKYAKKGYLNRSGFDHNYNKIKIIDSLITNDSLKNSLLATSAKWYLINGKESEKVTKIVSLFNECNTNEEHQKEINKLYKATVKLTKGNNIPNVLLVNSDNTIKDLQTIIVRPTVIFFWSSESMQQFKTIQARANELKDNYPNYDFIGINIDSHYKKWRDLIDSSGLNAQYEFQLENLKEAEEKLVINSVNKAIVVDYNGEIVDGNTNLFSKTIEHMLAGDLNQ